MSSPMTSRGWLAASFGLAGGVALGALLPESAPTEAQRSSPAPYSEQSSRGSNETLPSAQSGISDTTARFPGARQAEQVVHLSPERVLALFERVSNLRSDSRKYALAYRLAGQLGVEQIQEALKTAKEDIDGGDYVAMRALARRWAELDPKGAAAKGLEMKQQHLLQPVLESWSRIAPGAPLKWALESDPATQVEAVRSLLFNRLLEPSELELLVKKSASSENSEMRQQVLPFATMRLAESNPNSALQVASQMEDPQTRQRTLSMVLGRLSQSAPDVGKAWVAAQTDITPEQRQQYERALARGAGRPPR